MRGDPIRISSAKNVLRIYAQAVLRYPWRMVLVLIGVVGMQAANVVAPLYLRALFNLLARNTPNAEIAGQLFTIVGLIAFWWGVLWVSNRIEHFTNLRLISQVMTDLINKAFKYLLDHSHNFFISSFAGSLTHKVNTFARSFQVIYEGIFLTFLPTLLFIGGAVTVLYLQHHVLGIALGLWVVIFVIFQIWVTNLRQPVRRIRAEADTQVTATVADAVGNQSTIALFSAAPYEQKRLSTVLEGWRMAGIRSWMADGYIWSGIGIFMMGIQVGLLYLAIVLWQAGSLTVGDFVLIQAYLLTLFERLTSIQNDLRRFFDALANGGEMVEILATPHEIADRPGAKALNIASGEIWFGDVVFYFTRMAPVLERFNMRIAGGEKIALVGPSGAGKTTITKLLLRLYDVKGGTVSIDDQNIADVTQGSLREAIAFVPQEPILFHRTLMENMRYGRREATDAEVIEAAKKAHCHEFISKLPLGYNTYVGERGVKLSGGERQRVAIARAILKNAPILILDEATSSLDSESESFIQDALATLMQGKTVMVIAHRLSTIMKMDRIVVMEDGAIVAEGPHNELLQKGGLYQRLWNIQAGGFLVDEEEAAVGAEDKTEEEFSGALAQEPEEK